MFNYYLITIYYTKKKKFFFIKNNYLKHQIIKPTLRYYNTILKDKKVIHNLLNNSAHNNNLVGYYNQKFLTNSWLWSCYFGNLIKSFTGYKTEWLFLNISKVAKHGKFYVIWYKCYRKYRIRTLYIQKNIFLIWFIQLTFFKDVRGLLPFFQKLLINTHLKKHKKIFFIIRNFFKVWFKWSKKYQDVKGFSLFFKGKLGRKGSVRKMKFFSKQGVVSYTNKQLRVNYENYIVWTHTGVVGCGISVFF